MLCNLASGVYVRPRRCELMTGEALHWSLKFALFDENFLKWVPFVAQKKTYSKLDKIRRPWPTNPRGAAADSPRRKKRKPRTISRAPVFHASSVLQQPANQTKSKPKWNAFNRRNHFCYLFTNPGGRRRRRRRFAGFLAGVHLKCYFSWLFFSCATDVLFFFYIAEFIFLFFLRAKISLSFFRC